MSTKFDLCELVVNWKSGGHRLHPLQHSAGVAIAARIGTPISDGDFGDDEDVIVVWRDDELLNALGRMSEELDSVPVHFDVSADRQLVELLLSWKQGSEPFRDGARTTIWSPDSRRSAEDTAPRRGDGRRVGSCAAWAREQSAPELAPGSFCWLITWRPTGRANTRDATRTSGGARRSAS